MKNYIANESLNISTSAGYIREQLTQCITKRRQGGDVDSQEALIHLGAALHTLEDFVAHSNYVELALRKIGIEEVFCLVGGSCLILPPGPHPDLPDHIDPLSARFVAGGTDKLRDIAVSPLVTGTFGELDIYQSLIGEFDDIVASRSRGLLGELSSVGRSLSVTNQRDVLTICRYFKTQAMELAPYSARSKQPLLCYKWCRGARA